jgi:hypothetical protein
MRSAAPWSVASILSTLFIAAALVISLSAQSSGQTAAPSTPTAQAPPDTSATGASQGAAPDQQPPAQEPSGNDHRLEVRP